MKDKRSQFKRLHAVKASKSFVYKEARILAIKPLKCQPAKTYYPGALKEMARG